MIQEYQECHSLCPMMPSFKMVMEMTTLLAPIARMRRDLRPSFPGTPTRPMRCEKDGREWINDMGNLWKTYGKYLGNRYSLVMTIICIYIYCCWKGSFIADLPIEQCVFFWHIHVSLPDVNRWKHGMFFFQVHWFKDALTVQWCKEDLVHLVPGIEA